MLDLGRIVNGLYRGEQDIAVKAGVPLWLRCNAGSREKYLFTARGGSNFDAVIYESNSSSQDVLELYQQEVGGEAYTHSGDTSYRVKDSYTGTFLIIKISSPVDQTIQARITIK